MKKSFMTLLVLLAGITGFWSCSDDDNEAPKPAEETPALSLANKSWTFSREAGEYQVAVFANVAWKAVTEAQWLTLSESEGIGNGTFTITVPENNTDTDQTATITVKAIDNEKLLATFTITQEPTILKITSETEINVPAAGQTIVIDVEGNTDYTFEMSGWVTVNAAPSGSLTNFCALSKSQITLSIGANTLTQPRECDLVIKQGDKEVKNIHITQDAAGSVMKITVNGGTAQTVNLEAAGGEIELTIASNLSWHCDMSDWMMPSGQLTDAAPENVQNIRIAPNLTGTTRKKLVVFKSTDAATEDATITIMQKTIDENLLVVRSDYTNAIPYTGGEGSVNIMIENAALAAVLSCNIILPEGITLKDENSAGTGENIIVRTEPNLALNDVVFEGGIVEFFSPNQKWQKIRKPFSVIQKSYPTIKVTDAQDENAIFITQDSTGSHSFMVRNAEGLEWDYDHKVTNSYGYPTEAPDVTSAKSNDTTLTVTFGENPDYQMRVITLTVTDRNNPNNIATATITQMGMQETRLNVNTSSITALTTTAECQISYSPDFCYVEILEKENPGFVTMAEGWVYEYAGFCSKAFTVEKNTTDQPRTATFTVNMYMTKGGQLLKTTEYKLTQDKSLANVSVSGETVKDYAGCTDNIILAYDAKKALLFRITRSDGIQGTQAFEIYYENGRRCNEVKLKPCSDLKNAMNKPAELKALEDPDIYWVLQNGWYSEEEADKTYTVYIIPAQAGFDINKASQYMKAEIYVPGWDETI